jgi:hypothetical protein
MSLTATNALIIGCSIGGALILIAFIIFIVFVIYFRICCCCCKEKTGSKYVSNLTEQNKVDNSLEKKYSSQSGLPPVGQGLWTKIPSMQTGPAIAATGVSTFYKSENKDSFVRNIDKQRQRPKELSNNGKSFMEVQMSAAAAASTFEWPSIDDFHTPATTPINNNSFGSQVKLITTDHDVEGDTRMKKSKIDPSTQQMGGNKINVEAVIEKTRPFNGKMTIPALEKQVLGDAFKFLDEIE